MLTSCSYHAHLVSVLEKFPSDVRATALSGATLTATQIGLEFAYAHVFDPPSAIPVTLCSLTFERAATLFNLAAHHSQLAASEDRSSQDGLKRATLHYQVRRSPHLVALLNCG